MPDDTPVPDAIPADRPKPALPGNHGQFGADIGTDDATPLENHPDATEPASEGPHQTGAGERS